MYDTYTHTDFSLNVIFQCAFKPYGVSDASNKHYVNPMVMSQLEQSWIVFRKRADLGSLQMLEFVHNVAYNESLQNLQTSWNYENNLWLTFRH